LVIVTASGKSKVRFIFPILALISTDFNFSESFALAQGKGYAFISNNQIEIALHDEKLKNEQFDFILIFQKIPKYF
jgi:hypothetical protein